ncbi:unnamed protein product [Durusdinium trenchii]|uniref:Uncharacterized protein n=1 Tax=Durusdinium trenchii TaxID=1381693 RepID=A0ABP0I9J1_9DINO
MYYCSHLFQKKHEAVPRQTHGERTVKLASRPSSAGRLAGEACQYLKHYEAERAGGYPQVQRPSLLAYAEYKDRVRSSCSKVAQAHGERTLKLASRPSSAGRLATLPGQTLPVHGVKTIVPTSKVEIPLPRL